MPHNYLKKKSDFMTMHQSIYLYISFDQKQFKRSFNQIAISITQKSIYLLKTPPTTSRDATGTHLTIKIGQK